MSLVLGVRRDGAELPLVNKSMMYLHHRHHKSARDPPVPSPGLAVKFHVDKYSMAIILNGDVSFELHLLFVQSRKLKYGCGSFSPASTSFCREGQMPEMDVYKLDWIQTWSVQYGSSATFTFINRCDFTVWPGILANAGGPKLDSTGFELPQGKSRTFQAPAGWSGRFWGRTGCKFDGPVRGRVPPATAAPARAAPPVTLAEFTLGTGGGQDFYDVSLVDGYNLPVEVEAKGGSGGCGSAGCVADLNRRCPSELKAANGDACKSACEAFGSEEYCCSGGTAHQTSVSRRSTRRYSKRPVRLLIATRTMTLRVRLRVLALVTRLLFVPQEQGMDFQEIKAEHHFDLTGGKA
ncbi:unnamed protein product [Thlaspi arvense]|uniref:Thaumatin-like protein n=1 Tax=Thlaspi arvense TaxID=13288 RepID=A0AAU9RIZ6_THLAR|nr:unnamed protein product [Thlaspi arvense]